jgi:hypothetical protein
MSVTVKLNSAGIAAFLKGPDVQQAMRTTAERVAARAGDGFRADTRVGKDRARGYVLADSAAARRRQAREHVLERSVGGGL